MELLPVDLIRYIGSVFLSDKDRLSLAQVNCTTRQACMRDVDHVFARNHLTNEPVQYKNMGAKSTSFLLLCLRRI